jgi:hypothetical protein
MKRNVIFLRCQKVNYTGVIAAKSRSYPGIFLERLKKTTRNFGTVGAPLEI